MFKFKKVWWIYLPTDVASGVIFFLVLLFNVWIFITLDSQSHSVSDFLLSFFPYSVCSWAVLFWIAVNNQKK